MKKKRYFVFEDGRDKMVDRKTFIHFVKEFARTTFNQRGDKTLKTDYSDIEQAYNPQGYLIAWVNWY